MSDFAKDAKKAKALETDEVAVAVKQHGEFSMVEAEPNCCMIPELVSTKPTQVGFWYKKETDKNKCESLPGTRDAMFRPQLVTLPSADLCKRGYKTGQNTKCCLFESMDGTAYHMFDNDCTFNEGTEGTGPTIVGKILKKTCLDGQTPEECCGAGAKMCCMIPERLAENGPVGFYYQQLTRDDCDAIPDLAGDKNLDAQLIDLPLELCQKGYVAGHGTKCCVFKQGEDEIAMFDDDCKFTYGKNALVGTSQTNSCEAGAWPEECCGGLTTCCMIPEKLDEKRLMFSYEQALSKEACAEIKMEPTGTDNYNKAFVADEITDMKFCQRGYVTSESPASASKCCVGKTEDGKKTFAEFDNDCEVTGPDGKTLKLQDRTQAGGCTAGQTPEECCTQVCCMIPAKKDDKTMVFDYVRVSSEKQCTGIETGIAVEGYKNAFVADEMQDLKFCQNTYVASAGASKCCTGTQGGLNFAEFDDDCKVTGPDGKLDLDDSTPAEGCTPGKTPEECCGKE